MANPVIWGIIVGTFCYQYFVYFCMTWMPAYFVEHRGLSLQNTGIYTMFSFLGMAVVATLAGWAADRLIDRGLDPVKVRKGFIVAGFLVASTELFGAISDSNSVALFWAVFSLSGLGLTTANYWALTQTILPGTAVGRVVGIQNCAASLLGNRRLADHRLAEANHRQLRGPHADHLGLPAARHRVVRLRGAPQVRAVGASCRLLGCIDLFAGRGQPTGPRFNHLSLGDQLEKSIEFNQILGDRRLILSALPAATTIQTWYNHAGSAPTSPALLYWRFDEKVPGDKNNETVQSEGLFSWRQHCRYQPSESARLVSGCADGYDAEPAPAVEDYGRAHFHGAGHAREDLHRSGLDR